MDNNAHVCSTYMHYIFHLQFLVYHSLFAGESLFLGKKNVNRSLKLGPQAFDLLPQECAEGQLRRL